MAIEPSSEQPDVGARAWRARIADALAFNTREIAALAVLGVLVLGGAGLAYVRSRPVGAIAPAPLGAPDPSATASAMPPITVHVAGEVRAPGVYTLDEGARVIDAIRAARGFTRRADRAAINLARALNDGEQILVPARAPPGAPPVAPAPGTAGAGGLVNINTAGVGELEALPGIGPVLAQRIVDYREQHGPFTRPEDLQNVSGIGPKTFEALAPLVTV